MCIPPLLKDLEFPLLLLYLKLIGVDLKPTQIVEGIKDLLALYLFSSEKLSQESH
jgi:hypothetical protein